MASPQVPGVPPVEQLLPPPVVVARPERAPVLTDTVACAPSSRAALRQLELYAPGTDPVVLVGGTGTGKTHAAQRLHELSARPGRFRSLTVWELDPERAEDTLFGHVAGGFTGATRPRPGMLTEARNGTFLFDDFHLAPSEVQYKLLRVFDQGAFLPIGSDRDVPVTCRLVVAMREHPDELVRQGRLLEDLRYRLGYCIVELAPLAERREEIRPLAERFLAECLAERDEVGPAAFAPGVVEMLEIGSYMGNVRQLRAYVRAAFLQAGTCPTIAVEHLPPPAVRPLTWNRRLSRAEKRALVSWAVWTSAGCMTAAAERIGVHRNTIAALVPRERRTGRSVFANDLGSPRFGPDTAQQ